MEARLKRDEFLRLREIQEISETSLLGTTHIKAAQTLLRHQFPAVGGLFSTELGALVNIPAAREEKWAQIVHSGTDHWLLVAKGFMGCEDIAVYDSLPYSRKHRTHVEACMSALLKTKNPTFNYIIMPCQRQTGSVDCGIFAIAMATGLVHGRDPSTSEYDQDRLRHHLRNCLKERKLNPFPSVSYERSACSRRFASVSVYCTCRKMDYRRTQKWAMIQCNECKEWFYRICISNFKKKI